MRVYFTPTDYSCAYFSRFFYPIEDVHVHVGECHKRDDGRGDGWVPDHGQRVPEDVGRVLSGLARLDKVGPVQI